MADITKEHGYPSGVGVDPSAMLRTNQPQHVAESQDPNPDLRFPYSVRTWDLMRRTDSQVGSVLRAITLPIKRATWTLNTEGVRPEVVEFVRAELGLDVGAGRQRRRRHGVVWGEHLRQVLLMLPLGFMAFEQTYESEVGGTWAGRLGLPAVMHLRKLGARMPSTVVRINVGRDGGLQSLVQGPAPADVWDMSWLVTGGVTIPVDQLVMYVNEQEGADWAGTSILRTAYRDWFIKDQLVRVNAQALERNGMGVPKITYQDPGQQGLAEQVGREFRAGATSYLALPSSMDAELLGVSGSVRDALPTIQYHDQQIAKNALAMFLDLGHDAGARALGDTFVDALTDSQQAVAEHIADVATEHVIRDLVETNMGVDEPYPVLTPGDLAANARLSVEALSKLVSGGALTPDAPLEAWVRGRYGLPDADPATARTAGTPGTGDVVVPSAVDDSPANAPALSGDELVKRANFVGTMIRSGFDPAEAMAQAGLSSIRHLGLLPVTVQPPAKGTELDNAVAPTDDALADAEHGPYLSAAQALIEQVRAMRAQG